ncbi:MAG: Bacterial type and secretion system protein [Gemmataceae bacterium]|nr:Bacterial type and secretion system protein [Gemmataceae bacterium]
MRSHLLSALAAALALAATGRAADPPKPQFVTKTFAVADLVTPIPDFAWPAPGAKPGPADRWKKPTVTESAAQLARLVAATVRPGSWEKAGGPGTIAFTEPGFALTVTNTPEAVAEVATLLEGMRRVQDVSVICEVRVVKAPTGFCARAGLKTTGDAILTDRQFRAVIETAQGYRDASVMQFPKLTTFDGQVATVRAGEQMHVASEVKATRMKGAVMFLPSHAPVEIGDSLILCGRISADEKSVTLRTHLTRTTQTGPTESLPVTARITPVFEGGSRGMPVPVTQILQVPQLKTVSVEKTAVVPDGGTIVLGSWKEPAGDSMTTRPVMSDVPYLNQLFKTTGPAADYEVVALATVRVLRDTGEAAPPQDPVALPVAPMPRAVSRDGEVRGVSATEPAPAAGESPRLVATCPRVVPPTPQTTSRSVLLPEMEVALAEAHLALALADPPPPNREDLLEMARARFQRAIAKDPRNEAALRGLDQLALIVNDNSRPAVARVAVPAATLPAPAVVPAGVREMRIPANLSAGSAGAASAASVVVKMTIAKVPAGFVKDAGLADEKAGDFEDKWVLADLETRLLTAALRRDKKSELWVQPTTCLSDRQAGSVFVGLENQLSIATTTLTPGVTADGKKVVLKVETEVSDESGKRSLDIRTVVEKVPFGSTLVVRGAAFKMSGVGAAEILILMTVDHPPVPPGGVTSPPPPMTSVQFRR